MAWAGCNDDPCRGSATAAAQRDALYLRFYLGFDYAAIAQSLGIEVGTVSATLHAARGSLANSLQEVLT